MAEKNTPDIQALAAAKVRESFGALTIDQAVEVVKNQLEADAKAEEASSKKREKPPKE